MAVPLLQAAATRSGTVAGRAARTIVDHPPADRARAIAAALNRARNPTQRALLASALAAAEADGSGDGTVREAMRRYRAAARAGAVPTTEWMYELPLSRMSVEPAQRT